MKNIFLLCSMMISGGVFAAIDWSSLAAGSEVTVSEAETVNDSDMAKINACSLLTLADGGEITFNLNENAFLTCPVTTQGGKIIKKGLGELELAYSSMNGTSDAYLNADIEVLEGTLAAHQEVAGAQYEFFANKLTVAENAVFVTARSKTTEVKELWGAGVVTNRNHMGEFQFRVSGPSIEPCVFSGKISGDHLRWYSSGNIVLSGSDSNFNGSFHVHGGETSGKGVMYISKIGKKGEPSSIGKSDPIGSREYGACISYIGTGEETDKVYWYGNKYQGANGHIWDAGPTGGVIFNGGWNHIWGPSSGFIPEIVTLRGENTLPCIIAGGWIGDTETAATYIKKCGSGTWRFADNSERKMMGGIAVEEGVLQFDSIAETNENCSLGLAISLQLPYHAAYNESKNVDYAYLLGTENTVGTMEYTGTTVARCKTRPFAVNGRGIINNASALNLQLENAFAGTSSDSTLVLSAVENSVSNMFKRISDGSYGGTLSVEKQGKGSWMLKGAQTFSGSLSVKEGSLVIQNLPYTWFKLVIKEKNSGTDDNVGLQEIALYDSEGNRCNSNVKFVSSSTTSDAQRLSPANWRNLNVNEAAWDINGVYWNYNNRDGDKLLDDTATKNGCCIVRYPDVTGDSTSITLTDPKTWVSFVQRLDPTKSLACAFDILALYTPNSTATAHARIPITYSFEASSDGVLWDEVYKANKVATPNANCWYSDSSAFKQGAVRKGKGFSFANEVIPADDVLPNCSSVSVASGAVLEAKGEVSLKTLTLDASENGNGMIKGFAFAKTGEIFIENMVGTGAKKVNIVFDSCSDAANIEGWTLAINGQVTTSYGAYLTDGGISLVPNGTVIIVR